MARPRHLVAFIAVAIVAVSPALALGGATTSFDATVEAAKDGAALDPGTKKKPQNVRLAISLGTLSDAGGTPQTETIELNFAEELAFGGSSFKSCRASKLESTGACPPASKVGSGSAVLQWQTEAGPNVENMAVSAYSSEKGKLILLRFQGGSPVKIDAIAAGDVSKLDRDGLGHSVGFELPPELRTAQGEPATLSGLGVALEGSAKTQKGKRVPFVGLGPCPDDALAFEAIVTFSSGEPSADATDSAPCS